MDFTKALDEDVLHTLYKSLDVPELRSLRLLNRRSNAIASSYLYKTIIIRPRRDVLDNITEISQNRDFAKGVREVIWETGHYYYPLDETPSPVPVSGSENEPETTLPAILDAVAAGPQSAFGDALRDAVRKTIVQGELAIWPDEVAEILTRAFRQFTGLRRASIVNWACTPRTFYAKFGYGTNEGNSSMPIFFDSDTLRHLDAFRTLFKALNATGHQLESLRVQAVDLDIAKHFPREETDYEMLNMLIPLFEPLVYREIPSFLAPLQRLRALSFRFRYERSLVVDLIRSGKLALFLSKLHSLEDLEISLEGTRSLAGWGQSVKKRRLRVMRSVVFIPLALSQLFTARHTFARLRRLVLDFMWLDTNDLCAFLARQSTTLKILVLSWIMLGKVTDPWNLEHGMTLDRSILSGHEGPNKKLEAETSNNEDTGAGQTFKDGTGSSQRDLLEWPLVVQACWNMPSLESVRFGGILEIEDETPIPVPDPYRLAELALSKVKLHWPPPAMLHARLAKETLWATVC